MAAQKRGRMNIYVVLAISGSTSRISLRNDARREISNECRKCRELAIPSDVVEYISDKVYDGMGLPGVYQVRIHRRYLDNAVYNESSRVDIVNVPDTVNDNDVCRMSEYTLIISSPSPTTRCTIIFWGYEGPARYRKCRGDPVQPM